MSILKGWLGEKETQLGMWNARKRASMFSGLQAGADVLIALMPLVVKRCSACPTSRSASSKVSREGRKNEDRLKSLEVDRAAFGRQLFFHGGGKQRPVNAAIADRIGVLDEGPLRRSVLG